jgi:hypothetical protein
MITGYEHAVNNPNRRMTARPHLKSNWEDAAPTLLLPRLEHRAGAACGDRSDCCFVGPPTRQLTGRSGDCSRDVASQREHDSDRSDPAQRTAA